MRVLNDSISNQDQSLSGLFFLGQFFHALENWTDTKAILRLKNGPPMFLVVHMLQIEICNRKVVPKMNKSHIFVASRDARASELMAWATSDFPP